MKQWIKRLLIANKTETDVEIRSLGSSKTGSGDTSLVNELTESVVQFLSLTQKYVINCPSLQPNFFKREIHKIIDLYQNTLSPTEEKSLRRRSGQLIAAQWHRETEYLEDKEEELCLIIELITNELRATDTECRAFTVGMSETLSELSDVVEIDDIRQIRKRITTTVAKIGDHLSDRAFLDEKRIRSLEEQVVILQSRLDLTAREDRIDPLTRLHNQSAFEDRLRAEVGLATRLRKPLSLTIVDIDAFAQTNQTYGDLVGDEVLIELSNQVIKEFFHKTDYIARIDGDAFAVILCQTPVDTAITAANNLCRFMAEKSVHTSIGDIPVTISAGVTRLADSESAEHLLSRLYESLSRAQNDGGNRVISEVDETRAA